MHTATIIIHPRLRTPMVWLTYFWNARGYEIKSNRHGRMVLVRS